MDWRRGCGEELRAWLLIGQLLSMVRRLLCISQKLILDADGAMVFGFAMKTSRERMAFCVGLRDENV